MTVNPRMSDVEGEWIDITMPLRNGMPHWPEDPPVEIMKIMDMARGEKCNVSRINCTVHAGTHVDSPAHFVSDGLGIDRMPLDALMGPVRILPIRDSFCIKREELQQFSIREGERILFRTLNSDRRCAMCEEFVEDYVFVSAEAAEYLASIKPMCVGVDYLSVGGYPDGGIETHRFLLGAGIWLIEGLDLSDTPVGNYEMICLPVKIIGADGAFARAIVRKVE